MSFTTLNNSVSIYRTTNLGTNISPDFQYSLIDSVDCILHKLREDRIIRSEGDKIIADHIIFIDYISTIDINDILAVGGEEFTIHSILNPNKLNRHLEIYCRKNERGVVAGDS